MRKTGPARNSRKRSRESKVKLRSAWAATSNVKKKNGTKKKLRL